MNLVTVRNAINNHFGYVVPIVINSEPCICYGSPCHCDAVIGATTGTYPDNWSCVQNCCGAVPCVKCCKHNITQNVYQLPSWLYPCDCPAGHYEVPCGIIQPPSPITSALDNDHIHVLREIYGMKLYVNVSQRTLLMLKLLYKLNSQ